MYILVATNIKIVDVDRLPLVNFHFSKPWKYPIGQLYHTPCSVAHTVLIIKTYQIAATDIPKGRWGEGVEGVVRSKTWGV